MFIDNDTVLEEAIELYQTQDYIKAKKIFEKLANKKNGLACYYLGLMYSNGEGVPQDMREAEYFFTIGVKYGDVNCVKFVAMYYYDNKKYDLAFKYYQYGSNLNDDYCSYKLADMLWDGQGTNENHSLAVDYYEKAATLGNINSMLEIGNCYRYGIYRNKNNNEAKKWCIRACEYGHTGAMYYYARWNMDELKDIDTAIFYYKECINKSHKFSYNYLKSYIDLAYIYKSYCNEGQLAVSMYENIICYIDEKISSNTQISNDEADIYFEAKNELADIYYRGTTDVSKNLTRALSIYQESINQGSYKAMKILADIFYDRYCINNQNVQYNENDAQNYQYTINLYTKLANEKVDNQAMYKLGKMYEADIFGITHDYDKSLYWYEESAKRDNLDAIDVLGAYYSAGINVTQNYKIAYQWFEKSANLHDNYAMYRLALMYDLNLGVEYNAQIAYDWYLKAVKQIDQGNNMIRNNEDLSILYNNLGTYYFEGSIISKNYHYAQNLFKKAIEYNNDNVRALFNIGRTYFYNEPSINDYHQAYYYFEKASEKGHDESLIYLGRIYENGLGVQMDLDKALSYYKIVSDKNYNTEEYIRLKAKKKDAFLRSMDNYMQNYNHFDLDIVELNYIKNYQRYRALNPMHPVRYNFMIHGNKNDSQLLVEAIHKTLKDNEVNNQYSIYEEDYFLNNYQLIYDDFKEDKYGIIAVQIISNYNDDIKWHEAMKFIEKSTITFILCGINRVLKEKFAYDEWVYNYLFKYHIVIKEDDQCLQVMKNY